MGLEGKSGGIGNRDSWDFDYYRSEFIENISQIVMNTKTRTVATRNRFESVRSDNGLIFSTYYALYDTYTQLDKGFNYTDDFMDSMTLAEQKIMAKGLISATTAAKWVAHGFIRPGEVLLWISRDITDPEQARTVADTPDSWLNTWDNA